MNLGDGFYFAKWLIDNNKGSQTARHIASFLVARQGATGIAGVILCHNGHDLLETDLYSILRQAEPLELGAYYAEEEIKEENQARLDNARGKRY